MGTPSGTTTSPRQSPSGNVHEAPIEPPIEADETSASDSDSAFGDASDSASITTSLKSIATNFEYENGRRYHGFKSGAYFLPNDEAENDRLDLYHHLVTVRCGGKLHLAPIGMNPQSILDLGTGTGIWAILMGDEYPSAEVVANDLSPIQPSLVPPNVMFEVDDVEAEWSYSKKFDYIHSRYLAGSIKDWPRLMRQAFEYTKPGGWVEFQDFDMKFYSHDGTVKEDSALIRWPAEIEVAMGMLGVEPSPGPKLKDWVEEAGFVNIHHQLIPFPTGPWPKDKTLRQMGTLDQMNFLENLEGFSVRALTMIRDWRMEEVQVLLAQVRNELKNRKIHPLHDLHVVYAQKPGKIEAGDD